MSLIRNWWSRRSLWNRRLILSAVGFATLLTALLTWPTPYYITAPGAAIDTSRLVQVEAGTARRGRLLMLVVTTQPANLFWYLYARLDDRAVLETEREFLGEIPDYEKYLELTRQMMADSQSTAKAVALELLGYGQGVRSLGVRVTDLTTGSPSTGHLQQGDLIIAASGHPVSRVSDLTSILRGTAPGTVVEVRIRRDDQALPVGIPTQEHPDRPGTAALGIFLKDELSFDIPIPIKVRTGAITGPSAGLMFTLQIVDQLSPEPLAGGLVAAGTGTVEPDGSVGRIGGVQQKVFTAEAAGADLIFVPRGNYEAARAVATRVEVVPVDHVRDALEWLNRKRRQSRE